jgi:homocysteine S-methyltransferase
MSRPDLPQLADRIFLTDSGIETDLVFHHGLDLPSFATFPLLDRAGGRDHLRRYYQEHLAIAARTATGFILEAPTWRANADWGPALGYDQHALDRVNADAISFMIELATTAELAPSDMVVSGCIGPRSDAYLPTSVMDATQAQAYHRRQIEAFAATDADMVHAMTIGYADEATGIVAAAVEAGIPAAVSFTLETDGRLPDASTLAAAVRQVDAATGGAAAYFGINCAHPDHIASALRGLDGVDGAISPVTGRLRGLRANASRLSHAELDASDELDDGDPIELAAGYRQLREAVAGFTVLGGCCGTDARHVAAVAAACTG